MWTCPTCKQTHVGTDACPYVRRADANDEARIRTFLGVRELLTKHRPDPALVADWCWDGQRWSHASGTLLPGGLRPWERWSPPTAS